MGRWIRTTHVHACMSTHTHTHTHMFMYGSMYVSISVCTSVVSLVEQMKFISENIFRSSFVNRQFVLSFVHIPYGSLIKAAAVATTTTTTTTTTTIRQ